VTVNILLQKEFVKLTADSAGLPGQEDGYQRRIMRNVFPARISFILIALFLMAGCASHGPVLYPNAHLKMVGEEQGKKDIEECDRMAEAYVKSDAGKAAARSTAGGGAAGAVIGGAAGSVTGSLGRGAAIGAATGAAVGLVRGISKASQPSPLHKRFVDRCLRERGYDPLGWQ